MRKRASSRLRDGYADKPSSPMRKAIQTTAPTRMKRMKSQGLMLNSSGRIPNIAVRPVPEKQHPQQDDDDREQDRANGASDWNGDDQDEQGRQEPDRDQTVLYTFIIGGVGKGC